MELQVRGGGKSGAIEVSDAAFAGTFNETLVHQVVTAYLAGARSGNSAQKTRSQVSGGGSKPWRQKGTGRARAGSIRSPLWRGGGVTFAARPQDYSQKVNRKMYRAALRSIVSELVRQDRLVLVEGLGVDGPKTRELVAKLAELGADSALIVHDAPDDNLYLAARNIPGVNVSDGASVDPVSLVGAEKVVMTVAAVRQLEERLA